MQHMEKDVLKIIVSWLIKTLSMRTQSLNETNKKI